MTKRMMLHDHDYEFIIKTLKNVVSDDPEIDWAKNLEQCINVLEQSVFPSRDEIEEQRALPGKTIEELELWVKNNIS